jgi:hypothetical protein
MRRQSTVLAGAVTMLIGQATLGACGRVAFDSTDVDATIASPIADGATVPTIVMNAGRGVSCVAAIGGGVKCWGEGILGGRGDGSLLDTAVPVNARIQGTVTGHLEVADGGVCVKTTMGLECWGHNASGVLDQGMRVVQRLPVIVAAGQDMVDFAFTESALCIVYGPGPQNRDGQVYCAGDPDMLGDQSQSARYSFGPVTGINTARGITSGNRHFCALLTNGALQCWGNNQSLQLGVATPVEAFTPVPIANSNYSQVCGSDEGSCGLRSDGSVHCWGRNDFFELGDSGLATTSIATKIAGISGATAIACAAATNCAVLTTGQVKCWGKNDTKLLTPLVTLMDATPVVISGLSNIKQVVSRNATHACALDDNEDVYCWGSNATGESGPALTSPQKIEGLFKLAKLGGSFHRGQLSPF